MIATSGSPVAKWRTAVAGVFSVDPRSLAALRIGLGILLLLNLYTLLPDVPAFFTDAGVLSRQARIQLTVEEQTTVPPYWVSLHMLDGGADLQYALFAIAAVFAVALTIGYQTRLATFVSWALLIGLQARNPLILHGGDVLIRCLLFWCVFLPLGSRWSLDARRRVSVLGPICNVATAGLLIQLVCMYISTALVKDDPMWRVDGSALYYALQTDLLTTSIGRELIAWPGLLQLLTWGTLVLELAGPLVLIIPWRQSAVRTLVVFAFWGLHLGIAITMEIGLFPYVCMVYWLALLPGSFWDRVTGRRPTNEIGPVQEFSSGMKLLLGGAIAFTLLVTLTRTRHTAETEVPGPLRLLGRAAHIDQSWYLFAPRPHDFGGWFDVRGTLADGRRVSLLEPGQPPRTQQPASGSELWPSMPWRRLLLALCEFGDCPNLRSGMADYFRRKWNDTHPEEEQLVVVEVIAVMNPTPPAGEPRDPARTRIMVLARWDAEEGTVQPAVPFVSKD